jgi:hypothetical protein
LIFGDCWRLPSFDWWSAEVRRDDLIFVWAGSFGELAGVDERDDVLAFSSIFGDCWRLPPFDWWSEEVPYDTLTFISISCFGKLDGVDERDDVLAFCSLCRDCWRIFWFAGGDPELSVLEELFRFLSSRGSSY